MAAKRRSARRKRGTGTIQRQPDGTYIARTTDRSRSGRFPDRPAAEDALELWNAQLAAGANPSDSRQALRDFIRQWLTEVVQGNVAPSTYEFYLRHAGYVTAHIGDLAIEAVATPTIERCLNRIAADGLAPRSVDHVRAVLHNAFAVALRWKLVRENPVAAVPKRRVRSQDGRALTAAQLLTFIAAVEGTRLEALYHCMATLGLRRGEALGLRISDVDLANGLLHVAQQVKEGEGRAIVIGDVKSEEGRRVLPIPPDLHGRLAARVQAVAGEARAMQLRAADRATQRGEPIPIARWNPHGLLFPSEAGTPIQPSNFNRRFAALVRAIRARGGDVPADLTPHDLRKTALTDLAAYGEAKAVQSIAGHADIDTTMRIYAGRRLAAMRAAVEAVEHGRKAG